MLSLKRLFGLAEKTLPIVRNPNAPVIFLHSNKLIKEVDPRCIQATEDRFVRSLSGGGAQTAEQRSFLEQLKASGKGLIVQITHDLDKGFMAQVCKVGRSTFDRIKSAGDAFKALNVEGLEIPLGQTGTEPVADSVLVKLMQSSL